jgi:hypothetical protein
MRMRLMVVPGLCARPSVVTVLQLKYLRKYIFVKFISSLKFVINKINLEDI